MLQLKDDGNTIALMECLRDNPGEYHAEVIYYKGRVRWLVSTIEEEDISSLLELYPLDTWDDYKGMKRIYSMGFYFYIDGTFYFAD